MTRIDGKHDEQPAGFALHPAYPNPFNSNTTIRFDVGRNEKAYLTIKNIRGTRVFAMTEDQPGSHKIVWDGCDQWGRPLPSGIYLITLTNGSTVSVAKATLVR